MYQCVHNQYDTSDFLKKDLLLKVLRLHITIIVLLIIEKGLEEPEEFRGNYLLFPQRAC